MCRCGRASYRGEQRTIPAPPVDPPPLPLPLRDVSFRFAVSCLRERIAIRHYKFAFSRRINRFVTVHEGVTGVQLPFDLFVAVNCEGVK